MSGEREVNEIDTKETPFSDLSYDEKQIITNLYNNMKSRASIRAEDFEYAIILNTYMFGSNNDELLKLIVNVPLRILNEMFVTYLKYVQEDTEARRQGRSVEDRTLVYSPNRWEKVVIHEDSMIAVIQLIADYMKEYYGTSVINESNVFSYLTENFLKVFHEHFYAKKEKATTAALRKKKVVKKMEEDEDVKKGSDIKVTKEREVPPVDMTQTRVSSKPMDPQAGSSSPFNTKTMPVYENSHASLYEDVVKEESEVPPKLDFTKGFEFEDATSKLAEKVKIPFESPDRFWWEYERPEKHCLHMHKEIRDKRRQEVLRVKREEIVEELAIEDEIRRDIHDISSLEKYLNAKATEEFKERTRGVEGKSEKQVIFDEIKKKRDKRYEQFKPLIEKQSTEKQDGTDTGTRN